MFQLQKTIQMCVLVSAGISCPLSSFAQTQQSMTEKEIKVETFPWLGQLSKEYHKKNNPSLWVGVNSFEDYTQIEQKVLADMIEVMEAGGFFQMMVDYLVKSYGDTLGLHALLLKDAQLTADAFRKGEEADLYNLIRHSVTNRASEFYFSSGANDPLHKLMKSSEFFIDHVKAAVTVHYLSQVGYELSPVNLADEVNFDRNT